MAQKTAEIFDLQGKATGKITLPSCFLNTTKTRRNKTRRLSYTIQQNTATRQRPNGWKENHRRITRNRQRNRKSSPHERRSWKSSFCSKHR